MRRGGRQADAPTRLASKHRRNAPPRARAPAVSHKMSEPAEGPNREMRSVSPYLAMLLACMAFAVMGTLAHALGAACDWQMIALARTGLALLLVLFFARSAGVRLLWWRPRVLWVRSIAGSMSLVCTFYALTRLPVEEVFTLTNMFPLWVAVLSWPLLGEWPAPSAWLAVFSGVAGVVLIQRPHFAEGNFAVFLALASSFFTAVAMIGLHRLQDLDVRAIVVHFSAVGLVFCLASFVLFEHRHAFTGSLDGSTGLMLLGIGLSATVGQLWLTRAFAGGPPAQISVLGLTQVLFAMALKAVFLGELFQQDTLLGIGLIVLPTAWVMWRGAGASSAADIAQVPSRKEEHQDSCHGKTPEKAHRLGRGALRDRLRGGGR